MNSVVEGKMRCKGCRFRGLASSISLSLDCLKHFVEAEAIGEKSRVALDFRRGVSKVSSTLERELVEAELDTDALRILTWQSCRICSTQDELGRSIVDGNPSIALAMAVRRDLIGGVRGTKE